MEGRASQAVGQLRLKPVRDAMGADQISHTQSLAQYSTESGATALLSKTDFEFPRISVVSFVALARSVQDTELLAKSEATETD